MLPPTQLAEASAVDCIVLPAFGMLYLTLVCYAFDLSAVRPLKEWIHTKLKCITVSCNKWLMMDRQSETSLL
jgi:hypothetical protein